MRQKAAAKVIAGDALRPALLDREFPAPNDGVGGDDWPGILARRRGILSQ
jgi:hypothetical protein